MEALVPLGLLPFFLHQLPFSGKEAHSRPPTPKSILKGHEAHQLEAHRLSCSLRSRANQTASIPRGKQERQFSPRS